MKKVVITEFGDESKLAIVECNLPEPAAGEVQLSVEYSIVSGSDVNMRRGTYPFQKKAPLTPGYSVLGTVRLNGKGCSKFKVGDRVACLSKYEGQAELINLPERFLVPVPEGVDRKAAVALVLDWVTAYQMLRHAADVKSGQRIFIHGLSGAVGGALLSLGKIQGAQIFGTASSTKHEELRTLGAVPFDYSNKNWITAMQELGGADAVFDPLGFELCPAEGRHPSGLRHEPPSIDEDSSPSRVSSDPQTIVQESVLLVWQTHHLLRRPPLVEELHA